MDQTTHHADGHQSKQHAGHKISEAHGSHDRHAGHSLAMFRDKFWLSFTLTIPVVFWSTDVQHWFGYNVPSFPGSNLIAPILGTVVFFYGGLVFVRGAWSELADHKPGMMTLISLAITVAFATSLAATLGAFEVEVWWELATLITIMVLGHWLEMRAISQARGGQEVATVHSRILVCCDTKVKAYALLLDLKLSVGGLRAMRQLWTRILSFLFANDSFIIDTFGVRPMHGANRQTAGRVALCRSEVEA